MGVSKILVPHDGTEMSDRALAVAIEYAKALGSQILILHIIDNRFVPPSETLGFISDRANLETAREELIRILKAGAEKMLKSKMMAIEEGGIPTQFILEIGCPAIEIAQLARNLKVDLIVMGRRQISKNHITGLGSVAQKVSEISPCPVMTIR